MNQKHRKKWVILPERLPAVLRRCPRCGQKTEFENSGKFRVNANGSLLDVWMIYRCARCEASWNLSVHERVEVSFLDRKEYEGFLNNDRSLIEMYGNNRAVFVKNKAEIVINSEDYKIQVLDTPIPLANREWEEVEISAGSFHNLRLDVLLAKTMGLSRSRVKELCGCKMICDVNGRIKPGHRVSDGQVLYLRMDQEEDLTKTTIVKKCI